MKTIQNIYETLWKKSHEAFLQDQYELDDHLNHRDTDTRQGMSLVARLDNSVVEKICGFLLEGKAIEPGQYFYEPADIHITVLTIITCHHEFTPSQIDPKPYTQLIKDICLRHNPIKVVFKGITASPNCVMIQGFPVDDGLSSLRQELREKFSSSGLRNSMDQRYVLQTAHSSVIRLKSPILHKQRFVEYLEKYREYEFGMATIQTLEFAFHDWYMSNGRVAKIDEIGLCGSSI